MRYTAGTSSAFTSDETATGWIPTSTRLYTTDSWKPIDVGSKVLVKGDQFLAVRQEHGSGMNPVFLVTCVGEVSVGGKRACQPYRPSRSRLGSLRAHFRAHPPKKKKRLLSQPLQSMACPARFERAIFDSAGRRSIRAELRAHTGSRSKAGRNTGRHLNIGTDRRPAKPGSDPEPGPRGFPPLEQRERLGIMRSLVVAPFRAS